MFGISCWQYTTALSAPRRIDAKVSEKNMRNMRNKTLGAKEGKASMVSLYFYGAYNEYVDQYR